MDDEVMRDDLNFKPMKAELTRLRAQLEAAMGVVEAAREVDAEWKRAATYDTKAIRDLREALAKLDDAGDGKKS